MLEAMNAAVSSPVDGQILTYVAAQVFQLAVGWTLLAALVLAVLPKRSA